MDSTDRKILKELQKAPDLSVTELAARVGLSHTPCWRRLKKLETDGIIQGRAIIIDPKQVGLSVDVFAYLRLKQHDEDTLTELEGDVLKYPQIVECFSMTGESDYVLRLVVGSIEEYEHFLKSVLVHLPGVASVNSSFALKRVKMTAQLPL